MIATAIQSVRPAWASWWFVLAVFATNERFIEAQVTEPQAPATSTSSDKRRVDEIRLKLQLLSRAHFMHHDVFRSLPPPRDRTGNVIGQGLSWRVHLLPFIGEAELYEDFHFDEPWDSPHNKTLLDRMPDIYRLEGLRAATTRLRVFAGTDLLFGSQVSFRAMKDGAAHTILVIAARSDLAIPWTKPDELSLDDIDPAMFQTTAAGSIECVMADGQLLTLPLDVEPKVLAALVTPNGREIVDAQAIRRRTAGNAPATSASSTGRGSPAEPSVKRKLKDIVLAMHNYHDVHRCFPIADKPEYYDETGIPKLSWRVHLLPYLQQQPLYERFRLNEKWDSPHNKELLQFIPEIYREDGLGTDTRFITINGDFALFGNKKSPRMADITDGTTYTVLVVQSGSDKAIAWTKPDDNYFDPTRPFACLGKIDDKGLACVMADGAVWVFRPSLSPEIFSALVTPRGKEVINATELNSARIR